MLVDTQNLHVVATKSSEERIRVWEERWKSQSSRRADQEREGRRTHLSVRGDHWISLKGTQGKIRLEDSKLSLSTVILLDGCTNQQFIWSYAKAV